MKPLEELNAILTADLPDQDDPRKLAAILYERCYIASILDPPQDKPPADNAASLLNDLMPLLAAQNDSRPTWDEGWKLDQSLDDGKILARKGGAARSFMPGEFITHRGIGSGVTAGAKVSVFAPPGSADLQPEFYYAFSETVGEIEEGENTVRMFWNVSAEGAPRLMEPLMRELNRFQIPFRFKCVRWASDYPRRDAAVLYFHARYYPVTALVVESVHGAIRQHLNSDTPLFTKRMADGLAFAEDPGESFGENRMKILAAAMIASRARTVTERLEEVARQFEQRGLSFERPWLNAGSVDRYEFPFPTS